MRLSGFCAGLLTLLAVGSLPADVRREVLKPFQLEKTAFLKGFMLSRPDSERYGLGMDADSGATAVLHRRAFAGPSELNYAVFLFPSDEAMAKWDEMLSHSAPGWFSPFRKPAGADGVRRGVLGGGTLSRVAVYKRIVIFVSAYQHPEAIRRQPKLAATKLSDKQLTARAEKIYGELLKRARVSVENGRGR